MPDGNFHGGFQQNLLSCVEDPRYFSQDLPHSLGIPAISERVLRKVLGWLEVLHPPRVVVGLLNAEELFCKILLWYCEPKFFDLVEAYPSKPVLELRRYIPLSLTVTL